MKQTRLALLTRLVRPAGLPLEEMELLSDQLGMLLTRNPEPFRWLNQSREAIRVEPTIQKLLEFGFPAQAISIEYEPPGFDLPIIQVLISAGDEFEQAQTLLQKFDETWWIHQDFAMNELIGVYLE